MYPSAEQVVIVDADTGTIASTAPLPRGDHGIPTGAGAVVVPIIPDFTDEDPYADPSWELIR